MYTVKRIDKENKEFIFTTDDYGEALDIYDRMKVFYRLHSKRTVVLAFYGLNGALYETCTIHGEVFVL